MNFTPEQVKRYKQLHQGLKMEAALKPVIENKFGNLNKTAHFDSFDFVNDDYMIELKTRNIKWLQYPSLMFNITKIEKAKTITDKDVYFLWKLQDGLFYWKYKEGEYEINNNTKCCYVKNEFIKNYNELVLTN